MKKIFFILSLALVSCFNSDAEKTPEEKAKENLTTFYFIRHAEKATDQGDDPGLTEKGQKRAEQWVNYFFLKEVDHVISSDYNRTKATAVPLAKAKKLGVEIYQVKEVSGTSLLETYRGKTVALYGHSNTINAYANQLQNDQVYKDLEETDYDHFFIVRIDKEGNSNAVMESIDFMD
ncbi:histidine phosphatase family protein [Nonlabens sp. Ci31]|jgi:broad specificity phosphatase PhoE|uniref:SixA phosphatase family protein n=1 Tax=Nonlabens sp. Ci31 TaxID=2608253 RepID=UPI001463C36A|nr:phosphoglycerate mutase family protein [Nonlabens sp. Ci31]QJP35606.1 histidine phosphatase family protein [Nonlabens sp. Ci31]